MKHHTTALPQTWGLIHAALAGLVLMAGAGCSCVSIRLGAPEAYSGGGVRPVTPPPSGGSFVPVQSTITTYSGGTTVCGQPVSTKYVRFYPPSQTPNPGENAFRGYLFNVATGQIIPNSTYVLQWTVNINNLGCATTVPNSTTDVTFPATPGLSYKIAAHFRPNRVPPNNPPITLYGAWITP